MSKVTHSTEATSAAEVAEVEAERRRRPQGRGARSSSSPPSSTLFGSLIATYFYLRFKDATWPPPGVPKPEVTLPLVFTGMLILSVVPLAGAVRAAKGGG